MARHPQPYIVDADGAAKHLGVDTHAIYRYVRKGQLAGVMVQTADEGGQLRFDRRKLAIQAPGPGRPRKHAPDSGRTQVTHEPKEYAAWSERAAEQGMTVAAWLRAIANKRCGL